jgi:uncharacterized protein YggT (Ycf19 family)
MLLLTTSIKLLAEIALMTLLGQGLLALLAGAGRERNPFYRVLATITGPVVRGTRRLTPRLVLDRHVPLVAFLLLGMVWFAATVVKISLCLEAGVQTCR